MKGLLAWLLLGYAAYAAVMIAMHPRLIYPFQPDDRVLDGFTRVRLSGSDDIPVFVQERRGSGPMVLYFMGNAGAVPFFEGAFAGHIAADRHVIALEYRGGGGRPGTPAERLLKADALVAAEYAAGFGKPLIVQGFSLGAALAIHVASRHEVAKVVLTSPFDSLCRLMAARSWLPACVLPFVQRWRVLDAAGEIAAPVLVLHGAEDRLIPPRYSAGFADFALVERVLIKGAGHNDIGGYPDYKAAITRFLEPLDRNGSETLPQLP